MARNKIILEYTGHLSYTTAGRLLTMLKNQMENDGLPLGVYKKILSIMIEVLENIYKYNDQYHDVRSILENYVPNFKIEQEDQSFFIYSSNPIKNEHIPNLKSKLELINSKDHEELRKYYREKISDGKFYNKGGAGLGIIEIAKISGNPLEYRFIKIDSMFSVYKLKVRFN